MITIDQIAGTITTDGTTLALDSADGFALLYDVFLDAGLRVKQPYTFSWLGRPIIQFADDLMRLQELLVQVKPDVIIETGVAHGGSLLFHASICKLLGRGRVIGVDIEIRPHNRAAIEAHWLSTSITLIEGSSIAPDVVAAVKDHVAPGETVLLVLDSNHTAAHVREELAAYADLVTPGSFIVAMDGRVMYAAWRASVAGSDWETNNPLAAVREFAADRGDFELYRESYIFNESNMEQPMSGFRGGVLKRIR